MYRTYIIIKSSLGGIWYTASSSDGAICSDGLGRRIYYPSLRLFKNDCLYQSLEPVRLLKKKEKGIEIKEEKNRFASFHPYIPL